MDKIIVVALAVNVICNIIIISKLNSISWNIYNIRKNQNNKIYKFKKREL